MSTFTHFKRPSTTRRKIKVENFDLFESNARLRRVRDLLGDNGSPYRLDAILCILGVDSNHNYAMRELANYLLFGFFDLREEEYESEGYEDFVIEDTVILIMNDVVHVYVNPINYRYFEPYIASWRGLRVWCLSDKEYENSSDLAEDFKVNSFVSMTSRCKRIGIPFNHSGYSEKFDKMEIEKYPLIEAFASEQFSGRGFFTLNFDVFDVSEQLHKVYSFIDPVIFTSKVLKDVSQFVTQWNEFFGHMDEATMHVSGLDEQKVMAPFEFFFNHGKLALTNFTKSNRREHPFVLFGSHSNKANYEKCKSGQKIEKVTLGTAGRTGKTAKHLVVQVIAPNSPIRCNRSYFFGYDHQVAIPDSQGDARKSISYSLDMRVLNKVYMIVVQMVREAINIYTKSLSVEQANNHVMQRFPDALRKADLNLPGKFVSYLSSKGCLDFSLRGSDINGIPQDLPERKPVSLVKTARIILYDVPSVEYEEKYLGSLAFSESFLDSHFRVVDSSGKVSFNSKLTYLTERIPFYYNWAVYKNDREISTAVAKVCQMEGQGEFGNLLVTRAPGVLHNPEFEGYPFVVELYMFEKGIIFTTKNSGCTVIPLKEIQKMQFYDSQSIKSKSYLLFTFAPEFGENLPASLAHTTEKTIRMFLMFPPRTALYNGFYNKLIPLWEKIDKLEVVEEVPEEFETFYRDVSDLNVSIGGNQIPESKPEVRDLLLNLKINSCQSVVAKKHVGLMTARPDDAGSFSQSCQVWVTIIGGFPWSNKGGLAQNIIEMTKDSFKWVMVRSFDESTDFSVNVMQKNLSIIVQEWKQEAKFSETKVLRLMIVPPSCVELIEIVQGITSHPEKLIAPYLKIQSVIYCIEQTRAFINFNMTMPKLLDQCSEGLVNCIALTGKKDESIIPVSKRQENDLEKVQSLLRNVNTNVSFILTPNGEVTRSHDLETILQPEAFEEESLVKARYFNYPDWYLGTFKPSPSEPFMFEISLKFKQPLEKHRLQEVLKNFANLENLYYMYGKFLINLKTPTWFALEYWVPGQSPALEPCDAPTQSNGDTKGIDCYIRFYGHQLKEKVLKDFLRKCIPPKPAKKSLKSVETVTEGEKKLVQNKRFGEKLPPGTFFNGSYYVTMDGDKSFWHPDFNKFLEEYVNECNKEITAYNRKIDAMKHVDLFD